MGGQRAADGAEQPANEASAAAGAEDQKLGGFADFQQHAGGVPVFDGRVDVDVVAGDLVHGVLEDGFGALADHGVVHGGVAAVEPGSGEDRNGIGGHDVQRAAPALGLAGGPHEGALAVVRAVHAHDDSAGRSARRRSPMPGPDAPVHGPWGPPPRDSCLMLRLFCQKCRAPGVHRRGDPESARKNPWFSSLFSVNCGTFKTRHAAPRRPAAEGFTQCLTRRFVARDSGFGPVSTGAGPRKPPGNPGIQPMSYLPYPRAGILGILRGVAEPRLVFQNAAARCCCGTARTRKVSVRGIARDSHHFEEVPCSVEHAFVRRDRADHRRSHRDGALRPGCGQRAPAPRRCIHHRGRARPPGCRPSGQHFLAPALRRGGRRQPEGAQRNPAAPAQLRRQPQTRRAEQHPGPAAGPP